MFQYLAELDKTLLLTINGFHFHWLDQIMIFWSEKLVWLPLYAFILFQIWKLLGLKQGILCLIFIALGVAFSDQMASGFLKPLVQRLRPCHESDIQHLLFLPKGCGGSFGFASSHASNTSFIGLFCILLFKPKKLILYLIIIWILLMAWSRMYLAAHYPGDIMAGWLIGFIGAIMMYKSFLWSKDRFSFFKINH
jgi:undecaprenyl-diphosphatase